MSTTLIKSNIFNFLRHFFYSKGLIVLAASLIIFTAGCEEENICEPLQKEGIPIFQNLEKTGIAYFNNPTGSSCTNYKTALDSYIIYSQKVRDCVNGTDLQDLEDAIDEAEIEYAKLDCDLVEQCEPLKVQLKQLEDELSSTEIQYTESPSTLSCIAYETALNEFITFSPTVLACIATEDLSQFEFNVADAETTLTTLDCTQLWIGTLYEGGIIAYILQPGDAGYEVSTPHGLIISHLDQHTATQWGCHFYAYPEFNRDLIGADGFVIGTGNQNTMDILADCGLDDVAAKYCSDLILNEYDDWYLPSIDELFAIYDNKEAINISALTIDGTSFDESLPYWSSTEGGVLGAYGVHFGEGSQGQAGKGSTFHVRAIRSF